MINLLPPEVKLNIKYAQRNVVLRQYVVLVLLVVIVMSGLMLFSKSTLLDSKTDIDNLLVADRMRAASLEDVNVQANALSDTVDTIATLLEREVKFSLLLKEVGSIMPSGAELSSLVLSQDTTEPVRLTVALLTAEKAGVLQQNLIESELFISADIITVSQAGETASYPFAGELQAYYNPLVPLSSLGDPVSEEIGTDQ